MKHNVEANRLKCENEKLKEMLDEIIEIEPDLVTFAAMKVIERQLKRETIDK